MRWYNTINAALLDHLTNQIKETDNSGVWRYVWFRFKRVALDFLVFRIFKDFLDISNSVDFWKTLIFLHFSQKKEFDFNISRNLSSNSRQLVGFKNILRSIESYGIASVHGINYFGRGLLSSDRYVDYIRHDILGMDLLNTTINYVPSVKKDYKRIAAMPGFGSLQNW